MKLYSITIKFALFPKEYTCTVLKKKGKKKFYAPIDANNFFPIRVGQSLPISSLEKDTVKSPIEPPDKQSLREVLLFPNMHKISE